MFARKILYAAYMSVALISSAHSAPTASDDNIGTVQETYAQAKARYNACRNKISLSNMFGILNINHPTALSAQSGAEASRMQTKYNIIEKCGYRPKPEDFR